MWRKKEELAGEMGISLHLRKVLQMFVKMSKVAEQKLMAG